MRNDHILVRVRDLAGIPPRQGHWHADILEVRLDVGRRSPTVDEALQQRVAGHAIGAMQPREAGFTNRIQPRYIRVPPVVHHDATTGVVRCRHHRYRLAGDVDAKAQAPLVNGREMVLDELNRLVRDVQVDAVHPQALHFMVDRPCHDVARGKLLAWVEAGHEALPVGQAKQGAFATQGLGDQKALGLRVIKARRVELVELKVRDPAASPPGHGDTIAARAIWVAGVQVHFRRPTRGQHREPRAERVHLARVAVQHVGTQAALAVQAQAPLGDQVHRHTLLQQLDVRALPGLGQQGVEDGRARGVGGMDDAPVAMAAFTCQVKFEACVDHAVGLIPGKRHALLDQPLDGFAAVLHGKANSVFVAQATAGIEGVLHVGLNRIGAVQYGRYAPLGPVGRTAGQVTLAQHRNAQIRRQVQGQAQARCAAADNQDIMLELLAHVRTLVIFGGGTAQ